MGGRAPGRHSAGFSNVYKGPLPGRAGALRRGASLRACGPHETSPSPWSSANAAIFQPTRVTSGAAGAGAGVGVRWGQGCPTPTGPHVLPAMPAGLTEGKAAQRCGRGLGQTRFPPRLSRRGWKLGSASPRAAVLLRLRERWARATAVCPP